MLTLGVEEEFLLIDPDTGQNVPESARVLAALPAGVRQQSSLELRRSMVEFFTPVCTGLDELHRSLTGLRRHAADAAATVGARLVAVAATPVGEPDRAVPDDARFQAITRQYGPVAMDPACCGCHVHVGVADREVAVQVGNHLRIWLPVIQALAANSPFYAAADTGYASWRGAQLYRWPSVGATPYFENAGEYDRAVDGQLAAGVILDPGMVCWFVRPSIRHPTVEVRVADVCLSAADTVLIAGLVRALVGTALADLRAGVPAARVPDWLLAAAHWRAAHEGLGGTLLDPHTGAARPAWDLVDDLLAVVAPALDQHGDRDRIDAELARLRRDGTGAVRQRRAHERAGGLPGLLRELADQTTGG